MTNASVLWAVCFLPCSGNVHASDEFLLKQVEMKKINNADRFQDQFKGCHFFFFFLRRRRIQFSPRAKCDTRNMFCREYTDSLMNCSGTLFHSACLRPVFFFPFPFLSWLSSDAGNDWKTRSTFMEVELRCQTRYVQSSNSASCMEANYSIVFMICWLLLNVYLDSHSQQQWHQGFHSNWEMQHWSETFKLTLTLT